MTGDMQSARPRCEIANGDCLDVLSSLPEGCADMILADLPYGTTASSWDSIIDMDRLWELYLRAISGNGAIVLFASGRFTNRLIDSNPDIYRYKWVWVKSRMGNFVNANNRPMTHYEEICVFSRGITANTRDHSRKMPYHPQGLIPVNRVTRHGSTQFGTMAGHRPGHKKVTTQRFTNYPGDVLFYDSVKSPVHPTQKPIPLLEYLIRTYTDEGGVVLDNVMGSGSTGVAAMNTDRGFIGVERRCDYFDIAAERIGEAADAHDRTVDVIPSPVSMDDGDGDDGSRP